MNTVRAAYTAWSGQYDHDRNRTRDLDAEVTRRFLGDLLAGQPVTGAPLAVMVEAGCGTGKNTPFYRTLANRVTALDFSDGMLAQARAKFAADSTAGSAAAFAQADLGVAWPIAPGVAGLVAFNLVLEHLSALAGPLGEAARVLAPGGRIFISELHPFRQYAGKKAVFTAADGTQSDIPAFVHHLSAYTEAAHAAGLSIERVGEWWHAEDSADGPPRLLTLWLRRG